MDERRPPRRPESEQPAHPTLKAALLMVGIVVLLLVISILSVL